MSGEGFLSRWSRRKRSDEQVVQAEDARVDEQLRAERAPPAPADPRAQLSAEQAAQVLPELPPVESLTPQADFTPFMQARVPVALKNAALKKLFTDPHFNVMDGLDIYIDDYTKEDPIPPQMLRELAQSRALGLFDDEEKDKEKEAAVEPSASTAQESAPVAVSSGAAVSSGSLESAESSDAIDAARIAEQVAAHPDTPPLAAAQAAHPDSHP